MTASESRELDPLPTNQNLPSETPLVLAPSDRLASYRKSRGPSRRVLGRLVALGGLFVIVVSLAIAISQFLSWQSTATASVRDQYADHPLVVEHVGQITSCRFSFTESASPDAPEGDLLAFRVSGTRDDGFIYIKSATESLDDAHWAGLRVNDQFWPLEND